MNHYEVLGADPASDAAALKRAYLDAARAHHPDFHAGAPDAVREANARHMQSINEAWAVLGDPVARAAYDRVLRTATDPGMARRAAREPDVPAGKGWTPRAGDDGWMTDFRAWADEGSDLAPEPRSPGRSLLTVAPVLLFAVALVCFFVGAVVHLKELVALGAVCLIVGAGLFLLLPMFEMSRGRER